MSGKANNVAFAFHVPGIDSLAHLQQALSDKGGVIGDRYRINRSRDHAGITMSGQKRTLLTGAGIACASEFPQAANYPISE